MSLCSERACYKLDRDDASSMVSSVVPSQAGTDVLSKQEGNLLILDVRSFEQFHECHIFGARHYDPAQLTKATNNFPRELYYFRGPMGGDKMVVLYDHDGKGMQSIANTFVERGVENTYVLSGGLLGAAYRCPQLLVGLPPTEEEILSMLTAAATVAGRDDLLAPPPKESEDAPPPPPPPARAGLVLSKEQLQLLMLKQQAKDSVPAIDGDGAS